MNARCTVTLKNLLSELERMSGIVQAFGARHALPAKVVFAVNLALDEVLTNIMSYGYDDGRPHDIVVRLSLGAGALVVEAEDDGRPFNPLAVAEPRTDQPLAERPVGGLGLHLVRNVMDDLEYRRQGDRNVLVMRKSIVDKLTITGCESLHRRR